MGRHLPNAMLALFLVSVVALGTVPVAPMTVDFGATPASSQADVNPDLVCSKAPAGGEVEITCRLSESAGIARVDVESGGTKIAEDGTPPYEFTVRASELATVTGEKQFTVVLRDDDGGVIRRYTRRLSMVTESA